MLGPPSPSGMRGNGLACSRASDDCRSGVRRLPSAATPGLAGEAWVSCGCAEVDFQSCVRRSSSESSGAVGGDWVSCERGGTNRLAWGGATLCDPGVHGSDTTASAVVGESSPDDIAGVNDAEFPRICGEASSDISSTLLSLWIGVLITRLPRSTIAVDMPSAVTDLPYDRRVRFQRRSRAWFHLTNSLNRRSRSSWLSMAPTSARLLRNSSNWLRAPSSCRVRTNRSSAG